MDQLQVREAHFPLTKSVPIRHQITSTLRITWWVLIDICEGQGISKKPHAVVKRNAWFRWYVPPDSVRFSIGFEESQKVIVSEGHIFTSDKVNADQDIGEGQCWGQQLIAEYWPLWRQWWTSKKTHGAFKLDFWFRHGFDFWRRSKGEKITSLTKSMPTRYQISKKSHGALMLDLCKVNSAAIPDWLWRKSRVIVSEGLCRSGHQRISCGAFMLDFWKTARFRHGFPTDFWRRSSVTVCEAYILHLTKSMPIKTSEKVKASRKSRTVLSCLTSAGVWFRWYDCRDSRLRKVKSDCFRRSGQRISTKDNSKKPHGAFSWTSGRPADSVMDFQLTFEEGQAWLFVKLTSYPDKVNADEHIREGQNISKKPHGAFMLDLCRIFHYAWFRWHDSAWFRPFQKVTSHGVHHDLRPGGRLPRKCITECFRAGPAWKNPEAAAASQQLARYRRCLVLVQATALGNHSETVFLRQVCFLNWRGPGSWGRDLCPQQMNRWWQAKESEGKASVNPWEIEKIFIRFWRERLSHQFKGRMKLRKIIRDWSWCGN